MTGSAFCLAQSQRHKLDNSVYIQNVVNRSWGTADTTNREQGLSVYVMSFSRDSLFFVSLNLKQGFAGGQCKYSIHFKNNFFEIEPVSRNVYSKTLEPDTKVYVYGYLLDNAHLFVLFKDYKLNMSNQLLAEKGWMALTPIKK